MKSEMSEHHPKARKYRVEPEDFLSVCTKCFGLTSQGQNYQHCECEPTPTIRIPEVDCPNVFSLCFLCARDIAGGITRWSWLVCKICLQGEPRIENLPLVSMGDWKRYFPSSRKSSVEALKEFCRWVRLNTKQDEQTRNRNRSGTVVKES